jgi:tRNA A37 N6-isopentenylltransferase MiaA
MESKLSKALEVIRFVDIELTRNQKTKWRVEYNSQTQVLELAKLNLQRNWNDQAKRDTLNEAQARIQYVHQENLEVKTHFSIAKWIKLGDILQLFFHNGRPINEFSNQGQILIYHKTMLILAQSFF